MIDELAPDQISVIKYQSPFCRSCRQHSPMLDALQEQNPEAVFYTMDLRIDGKAAGNRMKKFFAERGVKEIPYVEVYRGGKLISSGTDLSFKGKATDHCVVTPDGVKCF